jgi:hypothetical protein
VSAICSLDCTVLLWGHCRSLCVIINDSHILTMSFSFALHSFLFALFIIMLYCYYYCYYYYTIAINVWDAASRLVNIIATFAIYGCPRKNVPTIATIVAFAASAAPKTFCIVPSVACALTNLSLNRTIANPASTNPIVPSVKNTCFPPAVPRTKCPVDTRFIGIAFGNWQRTIRAVPCVRKLRKRGSV